MTSKPKAVMLTHANCLRAGLDTVHCLWLDRGERMLTALPLFHVNGQGMTILAAMTVGGTAIVIEEFSASKFWKQVKRHRATQTAVVAMQLRVLIAQPDDPSDREHDVRKLFYAINVSDQEKEAFEERFGIEVINGYGLSEAMTLLTVSPIAAPRRWPSIGLPSPSRTLLLLDEDGNEVPTGEVGEICVKGTPGRTIMLGYYKDEQATAQAVRGDLLHTGDNAYADAEGYLYFFDRKKDMIKRAGENVSAIEVESVLADHPQELVKPGAAPAITGIANGFHVPGTLPGEGETQLFLNTSTGEPVSLTILTAADGSRWELVCGLEVHAELATVTKMFSGAPNHFGDDPNTNVDPVTLGLPGTLPVVNEKAVELAVRFGCAVGGPASIRRSVFARKNYFYPDMPKNFQISQYDQPIVVDGSLELPSGHVVGIERAHLEEDTGKSTHVGGAGRITGADHSLVDYNRAGVPLLEIVSRPHVRSTEQARQYVAELRAILVACGISDGKMEEGSMRVVLGSGTRAARRE